MYESIKRAGESEDLHGNTQKETLLIEFFCDIYNICYNKYMFRLSFLCTLIFCLIYTRGYSAEVITLKPSLTLQMYQNTLQEKQVKKEAKLRSVRTRAETVRKVNQSIVRTSAYQKIQSSLMPTAHPPLRTTLSVNTLASESPVVLSITQESIP